MAAILARFWSMITCYNYAMAAQRSKWYAEIAVVILVIVLVILCVFLVRQYRVTARQGTVSSERIRFAEIVRHHSLNASDTDLVGPWMTFDYVSVSFNVPPSYLMSALEISSSTRGFPNITLGHFARTIGTSTEAVTEDVRNAVRNYLASPEK